MARLDKYHGVLAADVHFNLLFVLYVAKVQLHSSLNCTYLKISSPTPIFVPVSSIVDVFIVCDFKPI